MLLLNVPAYAAIGSNSQVDAGDSHNCVVTTGGGVQCWGANSFGQLGDGTQIDSPFPLNVTGLGQNIVQVAMGGTHSCALTSTGAVKCWGNNGSGQLGSGDFDASGAPVDVEGLDRDVLSIAAGFLHTCALTTQGSVRCWGENSSGQLGNGFTENSNTPVQVTGLTSGIREVSAGDAHTCALSQAGDMQCWGQNFFGQLGNGAALPGTDASEPEPVQNLGDGVQSISAGGQHSCAITAAGAARCWGNNEAGQLGDGSSPASSSVPVTVAGLDTGNLRISAGFQHSCAVTSSGAAKCWGLNSEGQLGDGNGGSNSSTPVDVSFPGDDVTDISAGFLHTCAMIRGGGVQCFGPNALGQLGTGNNDASDTAVNVVGLSGLTSVAAGGQNACAINTNGALQCWGENGLGQLGNDAAPEESPAPVLVGGFHSGIKAVAPGGESGCLVTNEGAALCWGGNLNGKLGIGTNLEGPFPPTPVVGMGSDVSVISVGSTHACAVKAGAVHCWGNNSQGQLGISSGASRNTPVAVPALDSGVASVSVGFLHSCALLLNGGVRCWGYNTSGQLGNGTLSSGHTPVTPTGITDAIALSTGSEHTCAVLIDNTVRCWGKGSQGQLGQAILSGSQSPVTVVGLNTALDIALGSAHSCATLIDGTARCWGNNGSGRLGHGVAGVNSSLAGTVTGLTGVTKLAAGSESTCAAIDNGEIHCWGNNASGQLGRAGTFSIVPVPARGFNGLESLDAGFNHSCLLTNDGTVRCWGSNVLGQTGSGDFNNRNQPTAVSGLAAAQQVVAGFDHSCALLDDFSISCWGENFSGQLGIAPSGSSNVPVSGLSIEASALSAGFGFNCARTTNSSVRCWGRNDFGQLGNNSTSVTGIHTPVVVSFPGAGLSGVEDLVSGYLHSCSLRANDTVYCWGHNNYGQLGVGDETDRLVGTPVPGLTGVVKLAAGGYHTCALLNDNSMKCWGRNFAGQLGTGTASDLENTPQTVTVMSNVTKMALGSDHSCAINSSGEMRCWGLNVNGQLGDPELDSDFGDNGVLVSGLHRGVVDLSAGEGHTCAITDTGMLKCWGLNDAGQVGDGTNTNRLQWADTFPIRQTVGFTPPATASQLEPILLSAMTSSGLDAGFDSWTPGICRPVGDALTNLRDGYCGIRAGQAGNHEFAAAVQERRLILNFLERFFRDGFESP